MAEPARSPGAAGIQLGLMFFSGGEETSGGESYRLVIEGARFADQHGLSAVWVPERHFGQIGHLYPNPAVLHAALARETKRVPLRAGSVVLPLHHPIRVAEEWAVVDRLSGGRVGLAFASGWQPADFAFFPHRYQNRHEETFAAVETVRQLWRGEPVEVIGGDGRRMQVRSYPRPVQPELPVWLTAARSPTTFAKAGELGANVLTHLFDHDVDELAAKVQAYRGARTEQGHDDATGRVTVMLHTFLGRDLDAVRETVRGPFCAYLRTLSADFLGGLARHRGRNVDVRDISAQDFDDLIAFAFDRFSASRALIGTPETALLLIDQLRSIGVDEIACLLDFGLDTDTILAGLPYIAELRDRIGGSRPSPVVVDQPAAETPEAIRGRCREWLDGPAFYRHLRDRFDLSCRPAWQVVEQVWRGEAEAIGRLRPTEIEGPSAEPGPILIDSCFQVLLAAIPDATLPDRGGPRYQPLGLAGFHATGDAAGGPLWCHARLHPDDVQAAADLIGDAWLRRQDGQVVAEVRGFRLQRLAASARPHALVPDPVCQGMAGDWDDSDAPDRSRPDLDERIRARLLDLADPDRAAIIADLVRGRAARVLRVPEPRLSEHQPLRSLGLDSLMSLELKNQLEADLGVAPSIGTLLRGATIAEIVAWILTELARPIGLPGDEPGDQQVSVVGGRLDATSRPDLDQADSEALLARLDELSDEEVTVLLERLSPNASITP